MKEDVQVEKKMQVVQDSFLWKPLWVNFLLTVIGLYDVHL